VGPAYVCRRVRGHGSASFYLSPLFDAWGATVGLRFAPGTLNLCTDRDVVVPETFIPLRPWDSALNLPEWKRQPGYDPRLHEIIVEGAIRAWLFRWSAPASLEYFAANRPCQRRRACEIIAQINLTKAMRLTSSSRFTMMFR
jgi:hypothetical protein